MHKKTMTGFTLIELMLVVAIIGILAAIAVPSYFEQINKGRRAECRSGVSQALQQQERYFSQFNTYATVAAGTNTAVIKNFSGDSSASSACTITSGVCTAPGSTDIKLCVEVHASPVRTDNFGITSIYTDSDGRKGCVIGGVRITGNANCWP